MRLSRLSTSLFLLFLSFQLSAQCGLTVDAGPDAAICPGGGQAQLNASISGPNVTGFSWTPLTGLDNPFVLNPTAVVTGEITYTLTAEVFDPTLNLIVNGDFSAGDADFTTDYVPGTGGEFGLLSTEGQFAIATNSDQTHTNFVDCGDHTGGGNMMVVNGSPQADDNIWCQDVTVSPNTLYSFNAWLMSVFFDNPAQLQFSVNGVPLGVGFTASSTTCDWQQFSETWMSDAATTAQICITNQNISPSGNDFAIDDLFFGPVCVQTDEVTVREVEVEAQAVSPVELPCTDPVEVQLDGAGSSEGTLYFYEWTTTNGNIVSGATTLSPTVNQAGVYILTTLYDDGVQQCSDQTFVIVTENQAPTVADATVFRPLSCGNATGELSAAGSSSGPDITYAWSTLDGNIVSGADEVNAIIDRAGFYELTVTNTVTGCSDFAFVEIIADDNAPVLTVLPPATFSCDVTEPFRLDAFDSETGDNFSATWTTTDGTLLEDENTLNPLIGGPGTYVLTVRNEDNGCEEMLPVTVTENMPTITASIAPPPPLSCSAEAITLNGAGSTAVFGASYTWTTTDGNIVANGDTPSARIDAPGTYVLLVEDPSSGCADRDTVSVTIEADLPEITLQEPQPFTCGRANQELDANGTTSGPDITYTWTATNGGSVLAGENSLEPTVAGAGEFTLLVQNTATGCRRDTTFTITENVTPPVADAGAPFTLSCDPATGRLDGSGSGPDSLFQYAWSTTDGNLIGPADSLRPLIGAAGTYQLLVINRETRCSTEASVTILNADSAPAVSIATPRPLTCDSLSIALDASGSDADPGLTVEWTTANGRFLSGTDGLSPRVDSAGTYVLTITDPVSGCSASRSVEVADNSFTPPVEAGEDQTLNCSVESLRLSGEFFGDSLSYGWTSADGQFVGETDRVDPLVNATGRYFLTVTDETTGCTARDSVQVVADDDVPAIDIGAAEGALTCRDTILTLNPGGTPAEHISYAWTTTGGNILSGAGTPSVVIDAPGNYRLTVTDTLNGCSGTDAVTISSRTDPPVINVAPPAVLNCAVDTIGLNTDGSDAGASFSYNWTTTDGNILTGANGPTPTLNAAGDYSLTLINSATGCEATRVVNVRQDTVRPVAVILPAAELTCRDSSLVLDGSPSDEGGVFSFEWASPNGNFAAGENSLTPTIDAAGTYELTVRNADNGCVSSAEFTVVANQNVPAVDVGLRQRTLDCIDTVVVLGAGAGAMTGLSYAWSEATSGPAGTEPSLSVVRAGVYRLLVTDEASGCSAADTVRVRQDTLRPEVVIAPADRLTCTTDELQLSAEPAPAGFTYSASWTTTDGNIISATDGFAVRVDQTGAYQLLLTNTANGCSAAGEVVVGANTDPPRANIAFPEFITCRNETITLDASLSSGGGGFTYTWTTEDGTIDSGADTRTPVVSARGSYLLTVRDVDNGCTAEARIDVADDVELPRLAATPPGELNCLVSELDIIASSMNDGENTLISWTTMNGNILSGGSTLSPRINAAGTYLLTVLNEDSRCMSTLEVEITENLAEPVVDLGAGFDLGCDAKPVRLDARTEGSGPFTYVWASAEGMVQDGGTTSRPLVQGGGVYFVTVTDETNGCSTVSSVPLTQTLLLGFTADRTVPDCTLPFGSIAFTDVDGGTEPILYSVDGGATFSASTLADSLAPGRYALAIQDANGCELTDVIDIPPPPELDLAVDPTAVISLGDAHFINTRTNFADSSLTQVSWTPALDLDCADCLRPTATPDRTTTYVVNVMSSDGCAATDSVLVIVDVRREVYFPTGFSPNGDGINDLYMPFANRARVARVRDFAIYDRWGETVFDGRDFLPNDPAFGWDGKLNGRPLNPAVFVYSATVEFVDGRVEVFKGDFVLAK